MLTDLATWWLRQMLSLMPRRLREDQRRGNELFVWSAPGAAAAPALMLARRRGRRERVLGRFAPDAAGIAAMRGAVRMSGRPDAVVLRVDDACLLEQQVVLPLVAERDVGQVLLHDMNRLTPFRAEEVFWAWAIEHRDRTRAQLHVRLSFIPRAALDHLVRRLSEAGLAPAMIETGPDGGDMRRLAVVRAERRERPLVRRATQATAGVCLVLAAVAVALPFVLQSAAVARTESQIAALHPRVAEAEALRRRAASEASGSNAVIAERAHDGDAVAALAAVTAILPDNTFLSAFGLAQRQITMTGQSAEAARLIPALSNEPAIRDPSFAAPVTRNAANGDDLFSIRAELAP